MVTTAPELRLRAFSRHPKAQAFVDSPAKRRVVRAGRRGAKTTAVARVALDEFLRGGRVLYGTPTQDQVDTFWFEVKQALGPALDAKALYVNETRHIIEVPGTKQRIRAKTAWDADSLRGDYATLLILDEFQLMDEEAWERVGLPMLADQNGNAIIVYTPPSRASRSRSKARDPGYAAKLWKRAAADATGQWAAFHWTSRDNPYISAEAVDIIGADMTDLARRQELEAEDLDVVPGALWTPGMLQYMDIPERCTRVAIAVDPASTSGPDSDETGIIVGGLLPTGHAVVLEDRSLRGTPSQWARRAVGAYYDWQADRLVVEDNQGGEMTESVVWSVDASIPITRVHAKRGKDVRAEPVVARYERGQVYHVAGLELLEEQMLSWVPGRGDSPDRVDGLVHLLTELLLRGGGTGVWV